MKIGPPKSSASLGLALLVSNDRDAIEQLVDCMKQLAIAVEVCTDVSIALRMLDRRKFEVVIVDLQLGEPTSAVLERLRRSPSSTPRPTAPGALTSRRSTVSCPTSATWRAGPRR